MLPTQKLKEILKSYIKRLSSDLHSSVVGIIVAALILSFGGIFLFAKTLWAATTNILLSPMPVWVIIVLGLLVVLYIQTKTKLNPETSQNLPVKKPKTKFFDVGGYRWKATIYRPDYFELDKYPYCPTHDTKFVFSRDRKFCPGNDTEICKNNLSKRDEFTEYEAAKSIIGSKIRNDKKT